MLLFTAAFLVDHLWQRTSFFLGKMEEQWLLLLIFFLISSSVLPRFPASIHLRESPSNLEESIARGIKQFLRFSFIKEYIITTTQGGRLITLAGWQLWKLGQKVSAVSLQLKCQILLTSPLECITWRLEHEQAQLNAEMLHDRSAISTVPPVQGNFPPLLEKSVDANMQGNQSTSAMEVQEIQKTVISPRYSVILTIKISTKGTESPPNQVLLMTTLNNLKTIPPEKTTSLNLHLHFKQGIPAVLFSTTNKIAQVVSY